jgi:hypothetical protein
VAITTAATEKSVLATRIPKTPQSPEGVCPNDQRPVDWSGSAEASRGDDRICDPRVRWSGKRYATDPIVRLALARPAQRWPEARPGLRFQAERSSRLALAFA